MLDRLKIRLFATAIGFALIVGCNDPQVIADEKPPIDAAGKPTPEAGAHVNWSQHAGDVNQSGFSRLVSVNRANIKDLGLAWYLDLPGEVSLEATPLAVDGVLYFSGTDCDVYAVDAVTGEILWRYDPEIWKVNPHKHGAGMGVNRGVGYSNGKVFVAVNDGRLVALDAKTGKVVWSTQTIAEGTAHYNTGWPLTFDDKVMIGNGGGDIGARGYVSAYDENTGEVVWQFHTVPGSPEQNKGDPAMEMAAKTWTGEWWKVGTGGTVWNGMTYDPEFNQVYIGVGNAGPYNPAIRNPGGGDNLFVASIVALDADTGKYVWHYQQNPNESWDYKAIPNMILAEMEIESQTRKVVMQASTNGFYYVLDRKTGDLISAEKFGKVTWAERIDPDTGRPVEAEGIRYQKGPITLYPSTSGAHNWQDMSYSSQTGLAYIPYMQAGTTYSPKMEIDDFRFSGVGLKYHIDPDDPEDGKGALVAWDPIAQEARWKVPRPYMWNGGTMVTAGGLVFQGTADGHVVAHDAANGEELWHFNAGLGIIAAPITYQVDDRQYVSILVGWGGSVNAAYDALSAGWKYGQQPRRLLTFAIGGDATLPPSPPQDFTVNALDNPDIELDERAVTMGKAMSLACMACHGRAFRGSEAPGPDLRASGIALSPEAFKTVLREGALVQRGMPAFRDFTDEQVHALWSAIRAAAREALGAREASEDEGASAF